MPWPRMLRLVRQLIADRSSATFRSLAGVLAERDLTSVLIARVAHAVEVLEWRYLWAHWDKKNGTPPEPPVFPQLPGDPEPKAKKQVDVTADDLRAWRERNRERGAA